MHSSPASGIHAAGVKFSRIRTGRVRDVDRESYPLVTHQADRLHLPPGYELNYGADVLLLLRDDGSVVAAFSAMGTTPSEVARTAEEDYGASGDSSV
jgi:hypothetical protein